MNDNNREAQGLVPLIFLILAAIIYQNRTALLKLIESLMYMLFWAAVCTATIVAVFLAVRSCIRRIRKKIQDFKSWITSTDEKLTRHHKRLENHKENIDWLKAWTRTHIDEIESLKAEIASIKVKYEPKKEVINAEVIAKTEEAVQVYMGDQK